MLKDFERANYAIKWLCHTTNKRQGDVAAELGYTNASVLSQILTGKKPVPTNLAGRIAALNPRINIDFLQGNSDEMLLRTTPSALDTDTNTEPLPVAEELTKEPEPLAKPLTNRARPLTIPPELAAMFADLTSTVKSQQETINKLINQLTK